MREFEQMEMQFFVKPGTEMEWYAHWKEKRKQWYLSLGIPESKIRYHDHDNLAHYANAAVDIEFDFPMGFKEMEGVHSRTDFDLTAHEKYSGKKLQYFDPEMSSNYVPYVVETSMGVDRMFMAILAHSYEEEQVGEAGSRVVLKIHPALAPVKAAVFPLVKKDGLPEIAREIMASIKADFNSQYEEKDTIGKRYRRQDAIGTPFCFTVDHQTKEDRTVTVRHRDSMKQERISVDKIRSLLEENVSLRNLF
jgi:glycyl-tRNA synthetase